MLFQWSYSHMKHVFHREFTVIFLQHNFFTLDPFLSCTIFVLQIDFSCSNWLGTAVCIAADCTAVCFSNR